MYIKFDHFLEKFPEVELPITLTEDLHFDFSKENDPLAAAMIEQFINRYEPNEPDEFTEYIACFSIIPAQKDIKAIVYWKAGLLNYDYILATYNNKGDMIDKKAIAGMKVVNDNIKRIVAVINEDLSIQIVEGIEEKGATFDPEATKTRRFEITDSGMIEQFY